MVDIKEIVQSVFDRTKGIEDKGKLASYIPELKNVGPDSFGVHISTTNHLNFGVGNYHDKFSIQSIVKVLSLTMAYSLLGEDLWQRVKVEPSGTAFNSLVQLEVENGIPRNPFINAGALVVTDVLMSSLNNPQQDFLAFLKNLSKSNSISYSNKITASEKKVGYRNAALCNFLKSFHNIDNDPTDVLDFYYKMCSIEMSCEELSQLFLFLANGGCTLHKNNRIITRSQTKRINALMQTCGFYDESGDFAFRVGLPGKSGVGGGIVAVHPKEYAIAVWSPPLNQKGNSYKGMRFLEEFTTRTELSIF
ncbi:glutaminase [Muricauda ruestringensis]|nr:glutaminase [Allomuricauda ruestringensis]MCA0960006.1 glutaminase [Allomuricauda ruestringensis]